MIALITSGCAGGIHRASEFTSVTVRKIYGLYETYIVNSNAGCCELQYDGPVDFLYRMKINMNMRNLYFTALFLISFNVSAQSEPPSNNPATNSTDHSKPGIVIDGDKAYQTHPGTKTRDYSKHGYVKDSSGILRPTHLGTNSIDRSKPGIVWKGNKSYLTHLGTDSPDYSKPVYFRGNSGSGALKPISKK